MKSFLVIFSKKRKGNLNQELLKGHIDFLKNLKNSGCLVVCGPFIDNERGILVFKCESKEVADQIVNEDPFVKEKYYEQYEILEFIEANEENQWFASHPQTKDNLL